MVVFPVMIMLAVVGHRPLVNQIIRAVFLVLPGLMTASFALSSSIVVI